MMVFTCSCCSIKVVGFGFRAAVRSSLVEYLQWIIQMEMFVWLHPTIKHSAYGNNCLNCHSNTKQLRFIHLPLTEQNFDITSFYPIVCQWQRGLIFKVLHMRFHSQRLVCIWMVSTFLRAAGDVLIQASGPHHIVLLMCGGIVWLYKFTVSCVMCGFTRLVSGGYPAFALHLQRFS